VAALGLILAMAGCAELHLGTPAGQGQKYVIFFQPWSANLDDQGQAAVKAAAASALDHSTVAVTVAGYASPIGSTQANADLAKTRAQVVADALVSNGVPANRIKRKALGETDYTLDPIESRRVEISVGP
jgi:cytochrome c oxidase subunit 2